MKDATLRTAAAALFLSAWMGDGRAQPGVVDFCATPIARRSVLTGTIRGPNGQPLVRARVMVLRPRDLSPDYSYAGTVSVSSDDRGLFRAAGLCPGSYTAVAGPELAGRINPAATASAAAEATTALVPTYYPGSPDPGQAQFVTLAAGEERGGIDIRLEAQRLGGVDGRVVLPPGDPVPWPSVLFLNVGLPAAVRSMAGSYPVRLDPGGGFAIHGVPPGRYVLSARSEPVAGSTTPTLLWGASEIFVNGQFQSSALITTTTGAVVSGRVVLVDPAMHLPETGISIAVTRAAGPNRALAPAPLPVKMAADGTFRVSGVGPGRYRLVALPDARTVGTLAMDTATLNGRDVRDLGFDVVAGQTVTGAIITLAPQPTMLGGTVRAANGQAIAGAFVLVIPVDAAFRFRGSSRMRDPMRTTADGGFSLTGLPSGDYFIVAVSDLGPDAATDMATIDHLARAATVRLTLARGEKKTVDVKTTSGVVSQK